MQWCFSREVSDLPLTSQKILVLPEFINFFSLFYRKCRFLTSLLQSQGITYQNPSTLLLLSKDNFFGWCWFLERPLRQIYYQIPGCLTQVAEGKGLLLLEYPEKDMSQMWFLDRQQFLRDLPHLNLANILFKPSKFWVHKLFCQGIPIVNNT